MPIGTLPGSRFERNTNGHVILTFTGWDLPGDHEIERLEANRYLVSPYAKSCFLSTNEDSYDIHHRLVAGQTYKVALMPHNEIRDLDRTIDALRNRGMEHYGYGKPVAGLLPRSREVLSDKQMEEMGIWYTIVPHDPIVGSDGCPQVLYSGRSGVGRRVDAHSSKTQWSSLGASIFPIFAE